MSTSRATRILAALLAAAAGLVLVLGLGPTFMASFAAIPGNPVIQALWRGEVPEADQLHLLIESRGQALGWQESGRAWMDLGLAHFLLARGATGDERREHLEQSRDALERGLRLEPASPYAWLRMSHVVRRLEGPVPLATRSLEMALATGPREANLSIPILDAGLRLWETLGETERASVTRFLARGWAINPPFTFHVLETHRREDLLGSVAVVTEPEDDARVPSAVDAGLGAWPHLRDDDRAILARVLRRAWLLDPMGTADLIIERDRGGLLVDLALVAQPEEEAKVMAALEAAARLWSYLGGTDRREALTLMRTAWVLDPGATASLLGQWSLVETLASALDGAPTPNAAPLAGGADSELRD